MNIYDVAKLAKVSVATASKALNGKKLVSPTTRERVIEAAKALHYEPSQMARALALRQACNLGAVVVWPAASATACALDSVVLEGMALSAAERGYNFIVGVCREEGGKFAIPKMVRERSADGLAVIGQAPKELLDAIRLNGLPCVLLESTFEVPGLGERAISLLASKLEKTAAPAQPAPAAQAVGQAAPAEPVLMQI